MVVAFLVWAMVGLIVGTVMEHFNTRCPNNKHYRGDRA